MNTLSISPVQWWSHIASYHEMFNIPPNMPICMEALSRYATSGRVSILTHVPSMSAGVAIDVGMMHDERSLMTPAQKAAISAQHGQVPQTATPDIDWSHFGDCPRPLQKLTAKLLSISQVRWQKLQENKTLWCDVEPHTIPEFQYLINLFPNLCCLAVEFGDYLPDTILREVTQLYPIFDETRPAVLH